MRRKLPGSATVEAAIIYPIVILLIAFIISVVVYNYNKAISDIKENNNYCFEIVNPSISAESVLRIKWIVIRENEEN